MDDKKQNPISNALNVSNEPEITNAFDTIKDLMDQVHDDSAKNDFDKGRAGVHRAIDIAQEALEELAVIASSSQSEKSYMALSNMIKTLVDANKTLLDMHKEIKNIKDSDEASNTNAKTINNNLFVGSTAELQKMLEDLKKNDK